VAAWQFQSQWSGSFSQKGGDAVDFDFTEEQIALRGLAREVLTAESSSQEVRKQMADATGYSESLWKQLAETGLLGITIDEAHGGLGLGMIEQALVLE